MKLPPRRSNIPQDQLRDHAHEIHRLLKGPHYLPRFKALVPSRFNQSLVDEIVDIEDAIFSLDADRIHRGKHKYLSEKLLEKRQECMVKIRFCRFFVKQAIRAGDIDSSEFNFRNLSAVAQSNEKMLTFLDDLIRDMKEYEEVLLTHDLPERTLETLQTLHREMKELRDQQQEAIQERTKRARKRITLENQLWSIMVELSEASQFVLEPDERKYFKLPRQKKRRKSGE